MRPIDLARTAAAFALATLAACSHDSPTSPVSTALDGTWSLSISHLADAKVSCEVAGFAVTLTTTADSVSGTSVAATDSHASCVVIGGEPPYSTPFYPTGALTGEVSGSAVSFVLYDGSWALAGTRSGDTITGTATYRGTDSAGSVERTGTFTLRRIAR